MACTTITKGRGLDCSRSAGGVKNIYLMVFDTTTLSYTGGSVMEISDIEAGTNDIYKYALPRGTASVTETIVGDTTAGSIYYTPACTMQLNKLTKADQNEVRLLAQSKLLVFAELNQTLANGHNVILCLGAINGMRLNAGTDVSGAAWGDRNGYEWTFDGMEEDPMSMVADYTTTPFDNAGFTYGTIVTS
jgi:hypothetical protein|tara:strand:- start:8784 stop:9353 length:570 start_codon:yes stop_codon:yes gene_type:complete